MRGLPSAITAALALEITRIQALFKWTVGATTYRWTDCDQDIYFDGNWWTSKEFHFGLIEQAINGGITNINLRVTNVDRSLSNLALSAEIRQTSFLIYKVVLDSNLGVIGCSGESDLPIIIGGLIDSARFDRQDADLVIVDDMINSYVVTPRRTYYPTCPWEFKGTECGYVGTATVCNHTKSQCVEYGKQDNFGGWEYINELLEDNIYWGQRTKNWGAK
jgi:hypothetical protein